MSVQVVSFLCVQGDTETLLQGLELYLELWASVLFHQPGRKAIAEYFMKYAQDLRYAGLNEMCG
jgi:hypothetical protein